GDRLKKPIEDLAGGRVYTGRQALDLGLVDKIGTMEDAIEFAAARANLKDKDYDVRTVPEPKNFLQRLMEQAAGGGADADPERLTAAGPAFPFAQAGADPLWKLAAPYLAEIDPERARLIRDALGQLQLVQREGVILMMPPASYDPCGK